MGGGGWAEEDIGKIGGGRWEEDGKRRREEKDERRRVGGRVQGGGGSFVNSLGCLRMLSIGWALDHGGAISGDSVLLVRNP